MKRMMKRLSIILIVIFIFNMSIPDLLPRTDYIAEAATVKLNKTKINMKVGEDYQLTLKGTKSKVKWSSGKKSIAKVSSDGIVTGIKSGSTVISANVEDKTYECAVNVLYPTLNKSNFNAGIGDTLQLDIKNLPLTCSKNEIKCESNNEEIATVNNGMISALSEGVAQISVTFKAYKLQCWVNVRFTDENKAEAVNSLDIEYVELDNQIVCVIKNNSKINLNFGYDLAFYDSSNNLVSLSGVIGARDGFFAGDEKILYFDKTDKEYSYYKLRFNDVWGHYDYINLKDQVYITATDPYEFPYNYTDFSTGVPVRISNTLKLIDLNVINNSNKKVIFEAYVVYYKDNHIVNIDCFERFGNIDIGSSILKNHEATRYIGEKLTRPDYDSYKIIYSARAVKY